MRRLLALVPLLFASVALAQGYQPVRANCPSCVLVAQQLTLSGSLSASTVTASTSIQTPDIKGAGGQDRILLPSGGSTSVEGSVSDSGGAQVALRFGNSSALTNAISDSAEFFSDAFVTKIFALSKGGSLLPGSSGTQNIGSGSLLWSQMFLSKLCFDSSCSNFIGSETSGITISQGSIRPNSDNVNDLGAGGRSYATVFTYNAKLSGKVQTYNGVATAGMGVPTLYAVTPIAGVSTSTSATSVAAYTPTAQGLFEVGGHFEVTSWASGNVGLQLAFTNCQGAARTVTLQGTTSSNASTNVIASVGDLYVSTTTICANAASITWQTSISGTATATFWGHIKQVQ